jgi:hypothetical protein
LTTWSLLTGEVKKQEMEERFEDWIKKYKKKYRDEEEKAMRFQVFKATVEWIESQPPSVQKRMFPEISFFADFTEQEERCMLAFRTKKTGSKTMRWRKFSRPNTRKVSSSFANFKIIYI